MGADICSQNSSSDFEINSKPFDYAFEQDPKEGKIPHEEDLKYNCEQQLGINLADCQARLRISKSLYKDPKMKTLPVILKSLSSEGKEMKCEYYRPYVILSDSESGRGKNYKILDRDVNASDIQIRDEVLQYFGVVLCFLADNSQLIQGIIMTKPNNYGISVLKMNVAAKHEFIYIDDYILCFEKRPLFSQPIRKIFMWPCLLEKAWFKVKGNTAKIIEKNSPQEVLEAFLNFPIQKYLLDSQISKARNVLKQIIQSKNNKGYIVTSRRQPSHKIGLSGRKFYYLLGKFEIMDKVYYYLRNPCGQFDFRGNIREYSREMKNKLKEMRNEIKNVEGNFILGQDEFLEQIEEVLVIHYSKSSNVVTQELISIENKQEIFLTMDLKTDGIVSIAFKQTNAKIPDDCLPLTYQVINMTQSKLVSGTNNFEACFGIRNANLLENVLQQLKAGKYLIRLKKKGRSLRKRDLSLLMSCITVTGPNQVSLEYLKLAQNGTKFNNFLAKEGERLLAQQLRSSKTRMKQDIQHVVHWMGDLVFIYIKKINLSKSLIRLEVRFGQTKNLQCLNAKISQDFCSLQPFADYCLLLFEKIDLTQETVLGAYTLQSF